MESAASSPPLVPSENVSAIDGPAPGPAGEDQGAGPSNTLATTAASRRVYNRKAKKIDQLTAYTTSFVPGMYNIRNPAGTFAQKDFNVDVARQVSQGRARAEKEQVAAGRKELEESGQAVPAATNPLSNVLIIHPGSRNLRLGRASDFYPKEVPNCIARPASAPHRGYDAPVPGSRARRIAEHEIEDHQAKKRKTNGDVEMNGDNALEWRDPLDTNIGHLRHYLHSKLRANRLSTDQRDAGRVKAANQRARAERIPEHNDPYRIDWTELDGRRYYVGEEALRLPDSAGYKVRWPILSRGLNMRDWQNPQLLVDDIGLIIEDTLRGELGISQREYPKYSVILIVPDFGDPAYVEQMTQLLMGSMGFKEIAVHQEAYCAIFSAGMSSACVVDIGAQRTSVTCVDEGLVNPDTRINLEYGGDDITSALVSLLLRASFPYKELDLARVQEWLMMDNIKIRICTLEEHLVANTAWDTYVLHEKDLTQKYVFRTYDENILAPLCWFDTRMIDFEEKEGAGRNKFWFENSGIERMFDNNYDFPTAAMRACTRHLLPSRGQPQQTVFGIAQSNGNEEDHDDDELALKDEVITQPAAVPSSQAVPNGLELDPDYVREGSTNGATVTPDLPLGSEAAAINEDTIELMDNEDEPTFDIPAEAAKSPLDAAIAASISFCGTENKAKTASSSILLIGGSSALKGLGPFIAERLPPLLRANGCPVQDVQIVPPPRNLNPRFVSWKGASVMCNLESLSDMWIRRDEWEAVGPRALKDRYTFY